MARCRRLGLGRIEVLKGAASAVYGSEAVAGAVNLVSAVPETPGTELRFAAELGSFDTARASAGVSVRGARGWATLDAARITTQGISSAEEAAGNPERDSFAASTLVVSGGWDLSDTLSVGLSGFVIDSRTDQDGFDFATGGPADSAGREDARRTGLRVSANVEALGWSHEIAAAVSQTERFYPIGFTQRFDGTRRELSWQATRDLAGTRLTLGAETARESFEADDASGNDDTRAVFGEAVLPLSDRADVTLSLRADDHSEFGTEVTGRAALAFRPDAATVIRASAGTGYRAPSLYELFVPTYGNADLRPETSRSLDLGIERRAGPLGLSATVFWIAIDDLIGFGSAYEQVPGRTTSRGVELAADYRLRDGLDLFGNYTFTDATGADGEALVRVPRHDLTLGLRGQVTDRVSGALTVRHVAGLTDTDGGFPATILPLDDYTVADVAAAVEVAPGVELYGRIENLTDEDYQTTRGYGTPGRAVYAGIRASF